MAQPSVTVKMDPIQVADLMRSVRQLPGVASLVQKRAINTAIKGAKTNMSKYVRQILTISKTNLDKYITTSLANDVHLVGVLRIDKKDTGALRMGYFKNLKQLNAGARVKVYKKKAAQMIPGSFIETMKSGHKGIWTREYDKKVHTGRPVNKPFAKFPRMYRFPIRPIFGPKLQTIVEDNSVYPVVVKEANERLMKEMDRELKYEMSKL